MSQEKEKILNLFRKNPNESFPTSYIARSVYPDEYERILEVQNGKFTTKEESKKVSREKSKIHRRILHHLNKMVEKEVLEVSKRGENGEKFFKLNIDEGEEIIYEGVRKRQVGITKPVLPSLPIENYESKGVVKKYKDKKWHTKLDSILIESTMFDQDELYNVTSVALDNIKDVVGLNSFESVISQLSTERLFKLLKNISRDLRDFNKRISLIIDLSRVKPSDREKLSRIFKELFPLHNINIVFELNSRELQNQRDFIKNILPSFTDDLPIYFRNKSLTDVPYLVGEAGSYTFEQDKWEKHKENESKAKVLCCSQSTVFIDIEKFLSSKKSHNRSEFLDLTKKTYKSLFRGNTIQRSRKHELFRRILDITRQDGEKEFFIYGRNYIRFWNLNSISSSFDDKTTIKLLKSLKKDTDEFCAAESTIYKSCGMPIEFKVAFSPAIGSYPLNNLSKNRKKFIEVSGLEELCSDKLKDNLRFNSSLSSVYDGGNLLEVKRKGTFSDEDLLEEFNVLLSSYPFELFRYRFKDTKGKNSKINNFFGD